MIYGIIAVSALALAAGAGAVWLGYRCARLRAAHDRICIERNGMLRENNRLTARLGEARRNEERWRTEAEHAQAETAELRRKIETLRNEYKKFADADERARRELQNFWGYTGDETGQEDLTDGRADED